MVTTDTQPATEPVDIMTPTLAKLVETVTCKFYCKRDDEFWPAEDRQRYGVMHGYTVESLVYVGLCELQPNHVRDLARYDVCFGGRLLSLQGHLRVISAALRELALTPTNGAEVPGEPAINQQHLLWYMLGVSATNQEAGTAAREFFADLYRDRLRGPIANWILEQNPTLAADNARRLTMAPDDCVGNAPTATSPTPAAFRRVSRMIVVDDNQRP